MPLPGSAAPAPTNRITGCIVLLGGVGIVMAMLMIVSAVARTTDDNVLLPSQPIDVRPTEGPAVDGFGGLYSGADVAMLRLPESLDGQPIALTLVEGDVEVILEAIDLSAEASGYSRYVGFAMVEEGADPIVISLYEGEGLRVVGEGEWTILAEAFDAAFVADPVVSGVGPALVLVPSDADTAKFESVSGDGPLWVTTFTADGFENILQAEAQDGPVRFSWTGSPYVVLDIYTHDDTAWTLTVSGGTQ